MSTEFYIEFQNQNIRKEYMSKIAEKIRAMPTYVKDEQSEAEKKVYLKRHDEFWLQGIESSKEGKGYDFDVRIFTGSEDAKENLTDLYPAIEISAHPKSIEDDLKNLFAYLRSEIKVRIVDEDGEMVNY